MPQPPQGDKIFGWIKDHTYVKWQVFRLEDDIGKVLLASNNIVSAEFTLKGRSRSPPAMVLST